MQIQKGLEKNSRHATDSLGEQLRQTSEFQKLRKQIVELTQEYSSQIQSVTSSSSSESEKNLMNAVNELSDLRGRPLVYPLITSGLGNGPFLELVDGSVKYDMITGIGVYFFGHSHPAFVEEMINIAPSDIMQGNLSPGLECQKLLNTLISEVSSEFRGKSNLRHGWVVGSGTMANEFALKIIRQKNTPRTKIIAFKDCFAGRSTAMQEITDNSSYRVGQPTYGEVGYIPFYDPELGLKKSLENTCSALEMIIKQDSENQCAALMMELVQGEGGFRFAPREFYLGLVEVAKKNNLAIWIDEVQTFGRTGELFAFQKFGLDSFVDVVTAGKMLQSCVVLYSKDFNPQPGLVSATFTGSTAALRTATRTLRLLLDEGFLGATGKISRLSERFENNLKKISGITSVRALGGLIGFVPMQGEQEDVKKLIKNLFNNGVITFSCGHGPYLLRMLPPLGVMTDFHVDEVCKIIDRSMKETFSV